MKRIPLRYARNTNRTDLLDILHENVNRNRISMAHWEKPCRLMRVECACVDVRAGFHVRSLSLGPTFECFVSFSHFNSINMRINPIQNHNNNNIDKKRKAHIWETHMEHRVSFHSHVAKINFVYRTDMEYWNDTSIVMAYLERVSTRWPLCTLTGISLIASHRKVFFSLRNSKNAQKFHCGNQCKSSDPLDTL